MDLNKIDITSKMTGKLGNITPRPEVELKIFWEKNDSTHKLWIEGPNKEMHGPIELKLQMDWPIGVINSKQPDLKTLEMEQIRDLFFVLDRDLLLIRVFLLLDFVQNIRYLEGIVWRISSTDQLTDFRLITAH